MTQTEYEQKKRECWEYVSKTILTIGGSKEKRAFDYAFDRGYALGKLQASCGQVKETISQEEIECAAEEFADKIKIPASLSGALVPFINGLAHDSYLQGALDFLGKQEKDAEGEEMLMVSRKKVQEKWQRAYEQEAKYSESEQNPTTREELYYNRGILSILDILFGSKCLPDNVDSLGGNVDSLEPRFKAGDVAVISSEFKHPLLEQGGAIVTILSYHPNGDFYSCAIAPNVGIDVDAKYLEPYTEPKENIAESRKTSQNCDKEFDNILKDSFSKERRLNIAAMMAQAILTRIDDTPQVIADAAFRHADALIAESEKGGSHV